MTESEETAQAREAEFWDEVVGAAQDRDEDLCVGKADMFDRTMPWLEYMDYPTFLQRVFDHIGIGPGMRVLDLGCGKGFLAAALAHRGAEVDAIDISPRSVARCRDRAVLSGISERVRFHVMDCEGLEFGDDSFDAVCGSFVLHHLDLGKVASEIARTLKPSGRAAFIETFGLNPMLMLARATLPGRFGIEKASSEDEYPLDRQRIERLRASFRGRVEAAFPTVVFARMGGYLPFLNNRPGLGLLKAFDRAAALPAFLRSWSYYGVLTMNRAPAAP